MSKINFNVDEETHRLFVMVCSLYGQSKQARLTDLMKKDIESNREKVAKFVLGEIEQKSKRAIPLKGAKQKKEKKTEEGEEHY
jgi:hypothetical protein